MNTIDFGLIGSIFTVLVMVFFIGIVAWTFNKRNKAGFEEAAHLVFDDEAEHQASAERASSRKTSSQPMGVINK